MARSEINRSGEMEVFAQVVEAGSFSAAARELRMTPSAVSKLVARLETRLGTALMRRSTRRLQVTAEGQAFYENCLRILADMEAAEREAAAGAVPRGKLKVDCNVGFGTHYLAPLVPEFLELYPEISLELSLSDRVVDLMEEQTDLAIRAGTLAVSSLIARRLCNSPMVLVASPGYLARKGVPEHPDDLNGHELLGFSFRRINETWPFRTMDGEEITVLPQSRNLASDGETMRLLALAGTGLARLSRWHVERDISAGRLVPVLEDFNPGDRDSVHAVYVGQGRYLPARVRAFIDFLVERVKID
ncbi:LysR family transcriptional regulator [Nitratireductor basaltis]|uniref:LysR family transcriptional regulator n=1 Tax=Nitratireductor basaltis TaxID=472175 RepID=A0A084U6U5_9HYPH|nr:LysR family transcriptional regulator [Nitratireductor basaltis]KFB08681.1 LysR family transcriptional regulator [Nitratireductor basaltis]